MRTRCSGSSTSTPDSLTGRGLVCAVPGLFGYPRLVVLFLACFGTFRLIPGMTEARQVFLVRASAGHSVELAGYCETFANVSCSAPMVVLSPWPVRTTVSGGSVSSRSRIDARMVG